MLYLPRHLLGVDQQLARHAQARLQAVFMKAIARPGTAEVGVLAALRLRQQRLRANG
eukprot:gene3659-5220_t